MVRTCSLLKMLNGGKNFHIRSIFLLFIGLGCSADETVPQVKNCRIGEMYFSTPQRYSYMFGYNDDGTLKSITSPNYTSRLDYKDGRVNTIELLVGGNREVITFEYPSENEITWTSSKQYNGVTRQYYLYHTGDKVDSLKVVDPENLPLQEYAEYRSKVTYTNNNVVSIYSSSECCTNNFKNIENDNGLNPVTLLRQSTGVFNGYDILGYEFFGFMPEMLSLNNPTRYIQEYTQINETGTSTRNMVREFEYTYAQQGSYPIELSQYVDGTLNGSTYHFVYENCN